MTVKSGSRRGRPASASRDEVANLAVARLRAGERLDIRWLAAKLGLSRGTIHRWFGTRDELLAEVILRGADEGLRRARASTQASGAEALLATLDEFNAWLVRSPALRRILAHERPSALAMVRSPGGHVGRGLAATFTALIEAEVEAGAYRPRIDPETLGLTVIAVGQAALFAREEPPGDAEVEAVHRVHGALIGE